MLVLVAQCVSGSVGRADEWSTCQESGADESLTFYQCLEFLENRIIDRYPQIAKRSGNSLTLVASNPDSNVTFALPYGETHSYFLVAHFPKYAMSIVREDSHEWFTRFAISHLSGHFVKVSGWPEFSADGMVIAFFRGPFMDDDGGTLAIYSRFTLRLTRDYVEDYIQPMAIFHTPLSWVTAVTFRSNKEFTATMECREYIDVDDVGKHWVLTGQTEKVSFHYNGGIWRPSKLKQCATDF